MEEGMMRARNYISSSAYDPDAIEVILAAFEGAWAEIQHHFYDSPLSMELARIRLADELLAIAEQSSRDPLELKNRALQAMAMHYRLEQGTSRLGAMMAQRVHNARYWRSYADETLAIAEQMTDPECKRLLLNVAETYAQLARHAAAAEAAKDNKLLSPEKR
jgi:hypothetical protein